MFHRLAERIIFPALKNNLIEPDKAEEYIYGLELILSAFLNDITVLVIGVCRGMLYESIIYWLVYKILKKYVGGFHFNSLLICYLSTCIMCPVVLKIISSCSYDALNYLLLMIISSLILFFIAPVETVQKPLDSIEVRVYRRVARLLIVLLFVVYILCSCKNIYLAKIITISVISVALFAIAGKIKEVIYKKHVVSE